MLQVNSFTIGVAYVKLLLHSNIRDAPKAFEIGTFEIRLFEI
jgi:hypothetical protein